MVLVQLKLVSTQDKNSWEYPLTMILSIVLLFTIRVLRALSKLPSYIWIYIWPWISQSHSHLFSPLLCSPTPLFFHFPPPILSSTDSKISPFSFQTKLYGINSGVSKYLFHRLMLLSCFQKLRDVLLQYSHLLPITKWLLALLTVQCRTQDQNSWNLFIRIRIFLIRVTF